MNNNLIKNVVFDVGNVIVRWAPLEIVKLTFGEDDPSDQLVTEIFQSDIWLNLNKGLVTEFQAKSQYQSELGLSTIECDRLFYYVKHTQLLIFGSVALMGRLKSAGYGIYALTDNVSEIVAYLKNTYEFWDIFDGALVSSEFGSLKPEPEIFNALLSRYSLAAHETVFIDDMPYNVKGAESVGISAIRFKNSDQCEQALKASGLSF